MRGNLDALGVEEPWRLSARHSRLDQLNQRHYGLMPETHPGPNEPDWLQWAQVREAKGLVSRPRGDCEIKQESYEFYSTLLTFVHPQLFSKPQIQKYRKIHLHF